MAPNSSSLSTSLCAALEEMLRSRLDEIQGDVREEVYREFSRKIKELFDYVEQLKERAIEQETLTSESRDGVEEDEADVEERVAEQETLTSGSAAGRQDDVEKQVLDPVTATAESAAGRRDEVDAGQRDDVEERVADQETLTSGRQDDVEKQVLDQESAAGRQDDAGEKVLNRESAAGQRDDVEEEGVRETAPVERRVNEVGFFLSVFWIHRFVRRCKRRIEEMRAREAREGDSRRRRRRSKRMRKKNMERAKLIGSRPSHSLCPVSIMLGLLFLLVLLDQAVLAKGYDTGEIEDHC